MPQIEVDGLTIAYELVGDAGARPWTLTPGGRFGKDEPGLRETARALAEHGNQVLIWDRPNCGESSVCFEGESESQMQADVLAALVRELGLGPAVIAGGSGGARVSMLTATRNPDVAAALAIWWISGGPFGLMSLGVHYCGGSLKAAWDAGMDAVLELDEWREVLERNPSNRERFLAQDRQRFIATMERWMLAYCPCGDDLVPGLPTADARRFDRPALVFRSGEADVHHTRLASEQIADVLPDARLVEPPWGDREWPERQAERTSGAAAGLFVRWPLLVPQLQAWADEVL